MKKRPNNIKDIRNKLEMGQQDLADAVNSTKATISKLERGKAPLTHDWMKRLSVPLKCRPADFISDTPPVALPAPLEPSNQAIGAYIDTVIQRVSKMTPSEKRMLAAGLEPHMDGNDGHGIPINKAKKGASRSN